MDLQNEVALPIPIFLLDSVSPGRQIASVGALKIPDSLLEQADTVPGLGDRVARFIKMELTRHEMRQKRFRPETLDLVERAKVKADEQRGTGFDSDEERRALVGGLGKMTTSEAP